jgi:hypothetical protein
MVVGRILSLLSMATTDAPELDVSFAGWFNANRSFRVNGSDLESVFQTSVEENEPAEQKLHRQSYRQTFISRFHDTVFKMGKRLLVSERGLFGMTPPRARSGDAICILFGCSVPVVLREYEGRNTYRLIGECYVDGFMNGETLSLQRDCERSAFRII